MVLLLWSPASLCTPSTDITSHAASDPGLGIHHLQQNLQQLSFDFFIESNRENTQHTTQLIIIRIWHAGDEKILHCR